jgi:hypothetical protein
MTFEIKAFGRFSVCSHKDRRQAIDGPNPNNYEGRLSGRHFTAAPPYTGIDHLQSMIAQVGTRYPSTTFDVVDATEMPYADPAFDVVFSAVPLSGAHRRTRLHLPCGAGLRGLSDHVFAEHTPTARPWSRSFSIRRS